MNYLKFQKYSGAGNDFIIIYKTDLPEFNLTPGKIRQLCARKTSVGAEGLVYIDSIVNNEIIVEYYNSYGKVDDLNGTVARCVIKYCYENDLINNSLMKLRCNNIVYEGKLLAAGSVSFQSEIPKEIFKHQKVETVYGPLFYSLIIGKSLQIIVDIDDNDMMLSGFPVWEDLPIVNLGSELRYHKKFLPVGANVNFIKFKDEKILVRTYKKGVEAEVLSSASGATAAALVAFLKGKVYSPVELYTKSGDKLYVSFDEDEGNFKNIFISGPAKKIIEGKLVI